MLTITSRLRKYAVAHLKAGSDATDRELRRLFGTELMEQRLSVADIKSINEGKEPPKKKAGGDPPPRREPAPAPVPAPAAGIDAKEVNRLLKRQLKRLNLGGTRDGDVNPQSAFLKGTRIRVKEAAEQYDSTKKAAIYPMVRGYKGGIGAVHPMAGQPATIAGRALDHPSDRDKAVSLAFFRHQVSRSNKREIPQWARMTEHDREMLLYAAHNEKWTGVITDGGSEISIDRQKLSELQIRALLDDSVSGGIEITPVVFDDALILTPVLFGELFPFVDVKTIPRGRRVKGGAVTNPEFTSGVGEGTAIQPFNTSAFVTAFDTAIFPAVAAIELGQDFEEDTPVDLGGQIIEQFGLKAMEWLDRVIAVGNGYDEPQGIFGATAATLITSTFGAAGPPTVSDAEALLFGVPKQFRAEGGKFLAYFSNDYTYRKFRSLPVGPGDERRLYGMDHAEYKLGGYDHKIQNNIADGYLGFANLRKYRMYRRLGMQVRVETGGRQLALTNTRLIVVRMRYGGQLSIGGAAALMKDVQVV